VTSKVIVFKKILFFLSIFVMTAVLSACGVTETGNPYDTPDDPASAPEGGEEMVAEAYTYSNIVYGVAIVYPDGWSAYAPAGSEGDISTLAEVIFSNGLDPATTAVVFFTELYEEPGSLVHYLNNNYPNLRVVSYDTETLGGYMYDDPLEGPDGGDLREYFFLEGDVFIRIEAEVFADGEDGIAELLNGISFQL